MVKPFYPYSNYSSWTKLQVKTSLRSVGREFKRLGFETKNLFVNVFCLLFKRQIYSIWSHGKGAKIVESEINEALDRR